MCRRATSAVLGLLFCALGSGAGSGVYRWTDLAGREHYVGELSEVPPAQRAAAEAAAAQRSPSRVQTFASPPRAGVASRAESRGVLHVPYEQHGNAMLGDAFDERRDQRRAGDRLHRHRFGHHFPVRFGR